MYKAYSHATSRYPDPLSEDRELVLA